MNGELYEVVCAKFGHKIEKCPYLAEISHCVECPYARYLKNAFSILFFSSVLSTLTSSISL